MVKVCLENIITSVVNIMHEFSEFKGNKMITLYREKDEEEKPKWPFSFGKNKAKLIIENFDAIKEFAESED